jgi:hypothetical protein
MRLRRRILRENGQVRAFELNRKAAGRALLLAAWLPGWAVAAPDDTRPEAPSTPVERADDLTSKASASLYVLSHQIQFDVNLRKRFGDFTSWIGAFVDPKRESVGRVGGEYDFQTGGLLVAPALQMGTNGFVNGSFYAEVGRAVYGIVGLTLTNLKPLPNLTFDPNDALVFGAGVHLSRYDKVYAFSVVDVRLGTGQQDTHLLYRRRLDPTSGITLDFLFKSGHRDDGVYVRGVGVSVYFDRPTWFLKAAYDPWVSFTADDMVRLGGGLKF